MYEASGKEGLTFRLNSPITEEQWDAITDVDFEHTDRIWFSTKHGKEVEFVKRKKGKWLANGDIPKECPFCGEDWDKYVFGDIWYTDELPKFCPNCGADMREVAE